MAIARSGTAILLATYNGGRFLAAFLESLCNQTYKDFYLIVFDDCSSDNTINILKSYEQKLKIELHENATNLGPAHNFLHLTFCVDADVIFFADQDDIWHPKKIHEMRKILLQNKFVPMIVQSNLEVFGANHHGTVDFDNVMYGNFKNTFTRQIYTNRYTGCALAFNREFLLKVTGAGMPDPKKVIMHDWWLGLIAESCGAKTQFLASKYTKYRQHAANDTGFKKPNFFRSISNLINGKNKLHKMVKLSEEQLIELGKCLPDNIIVQREIVKLKKSYSNILQRKLYLILNYKKPKSISQFSGIFRL